VTMRALPLVIMLLLTASVSARADDIRLAAAEYPPYTSADLPDGGLLGELTRRAFAVSGHHVQIDFFPWARAVLVMRRGQYDGLMTIWPDKAMAEKLIPSRPLVYSELGFFVRSNTLVPFTALSQLKGQPVGTVRGYHYPRNIMSSGIVAEDAADDLGNLRKLAAQRFDSVLLEKQVGLYLLGREPDLQKKLVWQDPVLERIPLFIGFAAPKTDQPDWPALYEQGLKQLVESGEYQRILKKYGVTMP
jgi:polar amino acid transport system substrate-binding protein